MRNDVINWKTKATLFCGLMMTLVFLAACGGDDAVPTAVSPANLPDGATGQIQLPETATPAAAPVIIAAAPGELAPLPRLQNETSAPSELAEGAADSGLAEGEVGTTVTLMMANPFSNTTFTLSTDLPGDALTTAVYRHNQPSSVDVAQAQTLATRFGFEGDIFLESFPDASELEPGLAEFRGPPIYYAFDGPRTFSIDPWSANYSDETALYDFENTVDFATASQAAEAFLQERGLLDFPYVIEPGFGSDLFVKRQIDGRVSNQPEIVVGLGQDGRVSYVSYQVMQNLENLGNYPLISAAAAWTKLQSGAGSNGIPYLIGSTASNDGVVSEGPAVSDFQSWQRRYEAGELVQLYGWPTVYLPAAGSGTARVQLFPFLLQGDTETLNQIAEAIGQQITLEGVVEDDGRSVTVNSWALAQEQEPLSAQGLIRSEGEQVLFEAQDGQTFILPNAPADVPDGLEAFVFAWSSQQTGADYPLLQWESIDKVVDFTAGDTAVAEPFPVDPATNSFGFEAVTINGVSLAYYVTYLFTTDPQTEQLSEQVTILLQPVWHFTGTAVSGEAVEFFVQAVAEEFIQP